MPQLYPFPTATTLSCLLQGFAVAFSAFTDIGWIMVLAIGLHNVPEGLICAAPLYAATRSKWKVGWGGSPAGAAVRGAVPLRQRPSVLSCAEVRALCLVPCLLCQAVGVATASGLTEPLGASLALLVFKPFVKSAAALDYVPAATGGVMLAVCVLELWPVSRGLAGALADMQLLVAHLAGGVFHFDFFFLFLFTTRLQASLVCSFGNTALTDPFQRLMAFIPSSCCCHLACLQEGRRCGQDRRLLGGILLGTVVMAWTLFVGV